MVVDCRPWRGYFDELNPARRESRPTAARSSARLCAVLTTARRAADVEAGIELRVVLNCTRHRGDRYHVSSNTISQSPRLASMICPRRGAASAIVRQDDVQP
jgi:hypothetical protein